MKLSCRIDTWVENGKYAEDTSITILKAEEILEFSFLEPQGLATACHLFVQLFGRPAVAAMLLEDSAKCYEQAIQSTAPHPTLEKRFYSPLANEVAILGIRVFNEILLPQIAHVKIVSNRNYHATRCK